tara:strand:+ start:852 stop:1094 length:243 start_codon:yes stop_codon:yes gene_type:complete
MNEDRSYKTLEYMTAHYENLKLASYTLFIGTINELSDMANGGDFSGNRKTMFPCAHHTNQFFVDLLHNLGYDKDGSPLDE